MQITQQGINIVGYTEGMFGLGEAVRLNIAAARKHGIPLNLINYEKVKKDSTYKYSLQYPVNLVQVSLNDLESFFAVIDPVFFKEKYIILFLVWESEYMAPQLAENLNLFNEIWTTSQYCKKIFQNTFSNPIIIVPHPVEVDLKPVQNKSSAGFFDDDKFSFLFLFSYHSSIERKNPFFLINAFKAAFAENENVELVIKTVGAQHYKKARQQLQACASKNVKVHDLELDKNSVNHLINSCDSYVSMHHSEGFGLTLAEAMFLSKPVVATNYSGNTEFMNEDNSFLVNYQLGGIQNADGTFCSKTIWANPLMQDAIDKLREVYNNEAVRKLKADRAGVFVKEKLSFLTIGAIIKNRLDYLYSNFDDLVTNQSQYAYFINKLQLATAENQYLKREIKRMKKNLIIRFVLFLKNLVRKIKKRKTGYDYAK